MPQRRNGDYEVGFSKPPKRSQFKPGTSGNPRGRPKGRKNLETEIGEIFQAPVRIMHGAHTTTVSAGAAAFIKLREKAFTGDVRAIKQFLEQGRLHSGTAAAAPLPDLDEDLRILAEHEARFGTRPNPKSKPKPIRRTQSKRAQGRGGK
jgi:hypothetical protein